MHDGLTVILDYAVPEAVHDGSMGILNYALLDAVHDAPCLFWTMQHMKL